MSNNKNLLQGIILEEGSPEEFFEDPKMPRTKDFLSKVL